MYYITFQQGPLKGRRATVHRGEVLIGPTRDCDIRLPSGSTLATIAITETGLGRFKVRECSAVHELRLGGRLCAEAEVGTGEPLQLGDTTFVIERGDAPVAAGTKSYHRPLSVAQMLMIAGIGVVILLQIGMVFMLTRLEETAVVAPDVVAGTDGTNETEQTGLTLLDPHAALFGSLLQQEAEKKAAESNTLASAINVTNPVLGVATGDVATVTGEVAVVTTVATGGVAVVVEPPPVPPAPVEATNAVPEVPPVPATNVPPALVETNEPMTTPVGPEIPSGAAKPEPSVATHTPPAATTNVPPPAVTNVPAPAVTNRPAHSVTNVPGRVATNAPVPVVAHAPSRVSTNAVRAATNTPVRVATNPVPRAVTNTPVAAPAAVTNVPPAVSTPSEKIPAEPANPGAASHP